jgi:hypothetical protein
MTNATDTTLRQLREDHPGWNVWYVVRAVSRPTILWCAKPEYETQPIINADSPEELTAQLARQQSRGSL